MEGKEFCLFLAFLGLLVTESLVKFNGSGVVRISWIFLDSSVQKKGDCWLNLNIFMVERKLGWSQIMGEIEHISS